jgi:hypothetical protein
MGEYEMSEWVELEEIVTSGYQTSLTYTALDETAAVTDTTWATITRTQNPFWQAQRTSTTSPAQLLNTDWVRRMYDQAQQRLREQRNMNWASAEQLEEIFGPPPVHPDLRVAPGL